MTSPAAPARYQHAVIPHIFVDDAAVAIEHYRAALGAREIFRLHDDRGGILHAEIAIDDSVLMLSDRSGSFGTPGSLGGVAVILHVYVTDLDDRFARAIAHGAVELQPLTEMPYGARQGMVRDPFGHVWVLLSHTRDMTIDEIVRSMRQA